MANTGNKIYTTLKKVVVGGVNDGQELDINNQLCSISGLIVHTKNNTFGQADYIAPIYDPDTCVIAVATNVNLTYSIQDNPMNVNEWIAACTISAVLTVSVNIEVAFDENYLGTLYSKNTFVTIYAGNTQGEGTIARTNQDSIADGVRINNVYPNPAGGTTINYI